MKASVTAHQFRHSFATDLYDAGVGVLEAQKIMGHADISTTYKVYTHIRERKLEGAAQKLIAFYDGAESEEKDVQIFSTKSSKKVVK
jgi:integrase